MESPVHSLNSLFAQLGLASDDQAIDQFIESHKPIPASVELHEASCWSDSQAAFLKESITQDADWAEVVDHLNAMLR